ncbi:hypothetical protein ACSLO8_24635, partial [Escherichia coli]
QLLLPTDDEGQNNVTENYFLHCSLYKSIARITLARV